MLTLKDDPIPIRIGEQGVAYVATSRVPIDTVIRAFNRGSTAEEITYQYPALALSDVYGVIAYYLNHRIEVDAYLSERRENAAHIRQENEARHNPNGIRDRLLARMQQKS